MNIFKYLTELLKRPQYSTLEIDPFSLLESFGDQLSGRKDETATADDIEELLLQYIKDNNLEKKLLYPIMRPKEINSVPASILSLPIASLVNVGQSLTTIDQSSFKLLAKRSGLNLKDVKLDGVVLCSKNDMPVLVAVIQTLLKQDANTFARYDEKGKIIQQGESFEVDYWDVLNRTLLSIERKDYSKDWYSRPDNLEKFRATISRILALRITWIDPKTNVLIGQNLFQQLTFDTNEMLINVRPTYALYQLYKDDRITSHNREVVNIVESPTEKTILDYISSQRHCFQHESNKPTVLINPILQTDLIYRCYPNATDAEMQPSNNTYKNRRAVVQRAMASLRDRNLINYDEDTFKRIRRYKNIVTNVTMKTESFLELCDNDNEKVVNPLLVSQYLKSRPMPKVSKLEVREEYAMKNLHKIKALCKDDLFSIKEAFKGCSTHTINCLDGLVDLLPSNQQKEFKDFFVRVREARSLKPSQLKAFVGKDISPLLENNILE